MKSLNGTWYRRTEGTEASFNIYGTRTSVGVVVVEVRRCRRCAVLLLLLRKLEAALMAMFKAMSYELWRYAADMIATIGT